MAKFSIKRKGYCVDEVDGFIAKLLELTEEKLSQQAKRINELKAQVLALEEEKREFKAKENSVSVALCEAVKRADEIENASEVRYSLELQRLRHFRRRFSDYVERMKCEDALKADVSEYESFLKELEDELGDVMQNELNLEPKILPEEREQKTEEYTNGFNLQEALTPKETLEDICKELGLL